MSRRAQDRVREQLEQQIVQLGELRSAHTRDPNFKEWRQSTLTLIQRLWPGEPARSERFRRVPFSPPSSRATPEATREIFERGCAEAAVLLKSMLSEVEFGGAPQPAEALPLPPQPVVLPAEDEVTILELPSEGPAPASPPPPIALPLGPPVATVPVASPPAPLPLERVTIPYQTPLDPPEDVPIERGTIPYQTPLDPPEDVIQLQPAIELTPVVATPLPIELPMVMATPLDLPPPPEVALGPPALDPTPSEAAIIIEPEPPGFQLPPEPVAPPRPVFELPPEPVAPPRPVFELPPEPVAPPPPPPPPVAPPPRPRPKSVTQALKDMLGFTDPPLPPLPPRPARPAPPPPAKVEPPPPPPAAVEPPPPMGKVTVGGAAKRPAPPPAEPGRVVIQQTPAEPPHVERDRVAAAEAAEDAEATQEFMRTSPVLGASARPVQRSQPPPPPAPPAPQRMETSHSPAAASLIALAGDIAHLGVPDGQRAVARAMLLELAQQLDQQRLSWDTLRRSMTFIMEHQTLARRVVPLLIPYLDRAA